MEEGLPERTDKIIKDHNKHIHTMTIIYPNTTVQTMMTSWRKAVDENGKWLEEADERLKSHIEIGFQAIDKETEHAQKEIEEELSMSDEELFKIYKKRHLEYMEEKKKFIEEKEKKKKELEIAIRAESEQLKKQIVEDTKKWVNALKMWDNVKTGSK